MKYGRLVVCVGPMFAGKSETLIRHVEAARRFGMGVQVFKPKIDQRYSGSEVVSHSGMRISATPVTAESGTLPLVTDEVEFVGIDEVQFFGSPVVGQIDGLLRRGIHVTACGLDLTYLGEPFTPVPELMALADEVIKLTALCRCGKPATRTQLLSAPPADTSSSIPVLIGGAESYQPRCRGCHSITSPGA